ncbi:MAG: DUF4214 domain-containing protein [Sulfurimonas sp.]|nr:DUF4214 domain-containing protein [Sulfurimonas sp.]
MALLREDVTRLYVASFNRAPDAAGLSYWMNDTMITNLEDMATAFMQSAEMTALYPIAQTNTEFVQSMYSNMFGRSADVSGLAYWVGQLDNGTLPRESMIQTLINGALADTGSSSDSAVLINKTTVGLAYADAGLNDVADATTVMASVTADELTVTASLASVILLQTEAAVAAAVAAAAAATAAAASAAAIAAASAAAAAAAAAADISLGTVTVAQANAADANTTGVVTATISDTAANLATLTGTTGDYTLTISGAVAATLAELKAINAATTGSITLNAQTIAANLSGTAADLVAAFTGITSHTGTLTATGATTVAQANALDTATAGVVTATISDTAVNLATLTGTTGAYTLTISDGVAASVAELITINAATTGSITLNAQTIAANFSDTAANLVLAFDGITSHTGTLTATGATTVADLVTISNATTGGITATLSEVLTIASLDAATFDSNSNITLFDGINALTTVDALVGAGATLTINGGTLTGANTLTFSGTVEASGSFIVIGGAAADNITGGAGADTIKGGAGADTISLVSGGSDIVVFTDAADGSAAGIYTGYDAITGFTINVDNIQFGGTLFAALDDNSLGTIAAVDCAGTAVNATTDEMVLLSTALGAIFADDTTFTAFRTAIGAITTGFTTGAEVLVVAVDSANNTGIYLITSLNNDATVDIDEVQLLGVVNGTLVAAAGDFILTSLA